MTLIGLFARGVIFKVISVSQLFPEAGTRAPNYDTLYWAHQAGAQVRKHGAERPQKPYGLLGTGRMGGLGERDEGGHEGRGRLYTCCYTVTTNHQNDSCIKMDNDESHFNFS